MYHEINLNVQETITATPFRKLLMTAQDTQIPWLIAATLIIATDKVPFYDYFDVLNLARKSKSQHDYSTHDQAEKHIAQSMKKICAKKYPQAHTLYTKILCCYYNNQGYVTTILPCRSYYWPPEDTVTCYSDLSCSLAIALKKDYNQLLPLYYASNQAPQANNYLISFWHKVFTSLPSIMQDTLQQKYNYTYAHSIAGNESS